MQRDGPKSSTVSRITGLQRSTEHARAKVPRPESLMASESSERPSILLSMKPALGS
jgi:hypothetical protein